MFCEVRLAGEPREMWRNPQMRCALRAGLFRCVRLWECVLPKVCGER